MHDVRSGGTTPRSGPTGQGGPAADRPAGCGLTHDEELLCCLGPAFPPLAVTDPERVRRIAAELSDGFRQLDELHRAVSVFGSARLAEPHPDYVRARETARRLGVAGFAVITGGGPGIMEAANRGAQDAAGLSIGLNIELPAEQAVNPYVDLSLTFRYFFVRKLMFARYASAFVVFPGGFGTLDELFEMLTLAQTGKVKHVPVVLVGTRHWGGLLDWMQDELVDTGLIAPVDRTGLLLTDEPSEVVAWVARAWRTQPRSSPAPGVTPQHQLA